MIIIFEHEFVPLVVEISGFEANLSTKGSIGYLVTLLHRIKNSQEILPIAKPLDPSTLKVCPITRSKLRHEFLVMSS